MTGSPSVLARRRPDEHRRGRRRSAGPEGARSGRRPSARSSRSGSSGRCSARSCCPPRRRAGPRGADRAGLPAHELPAAVGVHLRHRHLPWLLGGPLLSTLADRLPRHRVLIATDAARAAAGRLMAIPGTPLPVLLGLLFLVVAVRATVRVGALGAHGRRARGRPVRRRDLADQHHACSWPRWSASCRPGPWSPCCTRRRRCCIDAATFAVSARVAGAGLQRRPAPPAEAGEGPRSLWQDAADGLRLIGRTPAAAGDHRRAVAGHDVRLRLGGRGRTAGRGARAGRRRVDRHPAGGQPARRDHRRAGHRPAGAPDRRERLVAPLVVLSLLPLLVAGLVAAIAGPGSMPFAVVVGLLFVSGLGASWLIPLNVSFVQAVPSAYRGRAFGVAVSGLYGVQGIGALARRPRRRGRARPAASSPLSGGLGLLAVVPALVAYRRTQGHVAATRRRLRDHRRHERVEPVPALGPHLLRRGRRCADLHRGSSPASTPACAPIRCSRPLYPQDDWDGAEARLRGFLEQYWGGPTTYSQQRGHPRLRMRHAPFAIGPAERDAWLTHMRDAVDSLELAARAGRDALGLPGDGGAQHAEPLPRRRARRPLPH